ncbi:MAG TPA: branched-chain amino acid transaminase [Desulfurobacteriaceae bacterium]|nr:branched-chain amino acid transaminase [Desulfurobacteriaceae bacterium]
MYAYFEGKFVKEEDAKISIKTNSFHYGTAVFEGIRAYYNKEEDQLYLLFAKEHYERLIKNCKILNMKLNLSVDKLVDITLELLRKCNWKQDVYIRPIVYFKDLAISPKLIGYTPEIAIYTIPLGDYIDTSNGIKCIVSSYFRINDNMIPARAKVCGAYVNSAFAKTEALMRGADEAIMLNPDGTVAEGSAENIFIVRNENLITPPLSANILEGITRQAIIKIAQEDLNIKVFERDILRSELYVSDEIFLCGTGAQVSPVVEVDGRKIGDGKPGKITKKIQDYYFKIVRGKVEKYKNSWLIPVY